MRIVAPGEGANTVPQADLLLDYADAFVSGDAELLAGRRNTLARHMGGEATVDAAGIVAIFTAVVRIADATGIPLEDFKVEASVDIRAELGIDAYRPAPASSESSA